MNKKIINLATLFILTSALNSVLQADDTDIYFPPPAENGAPGKHNVLFIMDVSGSMRSLSSDHSQTRFEAMEQAFDNMITTAPEGINVGLMNFGSIGSSRNSFAQGVKFPVSPIGGDAQAILEASLPNDGSGNPDWNASNIPNPGADKTVRIYLKEVVNTWTPRGWTPLVDSLYEAALYFRGEKVAWGTGPEAEINNDWVAHPSTYTGSLSEWDVADCTNTIIERLPMGEVPAEYRCPDPAAPSSPGTWANCAATAHACAAGLGGSGEGLEPVNATLTLPGSWNNSGGRSSTSSRNPIYTFTVTQDSSIEINLERVQTGPDTYLYLLDSGGNILEEDDDGGIWPNSKIVRDLSAGTYKLVLATYENNESGDFNLTIEGHVSNLIDPSGNSHVAFGGKWISSGGKDATSPNNPSYDFTVNSSGTVSILLDTSHSSNAYLYLLNSNGSIIAQNNNGGGHRDAYLSRNLDAGNYTIVAATRHAGQTDDFIFTLSGNISNMSGSGSALNYPSIRYVKLKALSEINGNPWTSIAEIDLIDGNDQEMDQSQWSIESFDSEETTGENGSASNAIDNNLNTIWHTEWAATDPVHPHEIVIDLGSEENIKAFKYLPRQDMPNGRINAYEVYFTNDLSDWGAPVAAGSFLGGTGSKTLTFPKAIYGSGNGSGNGSGSGGTGNGGGNGKVLMCHIPPGNPSNAHTISISVAAVPAHLAHNDNMGECPLATAKLGNNKVTICHIPPGNPDNAHTITISRNALQTHIDRHGDNEGSCGTVSGGTWTGQTPGTCAYTMCAGGITTEPTYITPIKAECQSNTIVLLSDGKPENASWIPTNPTYEKIAGGEWTGGFASVFDGLNCENAPSGFVKGRCGPEMTTYLATHDNNTQVTGDQLINTYTIGLGLGAGSDAESYLKSLSTVDDAETTEVIEGYYSASNQQQLATVFSDIISTIQTQETTTSFSNPGYSIVAKNGLNHEESVYIPIFEPGPNAVWKGNLKKFKFVNANGERKIQGKNNLDAMTEMSAITTAALDFWSESESTPDGDDITAGGVINKLSPASRQLYSDIVSADLSASSNTLNISNLEGSNNGNSNGNISPYMLGLTSSATDAEMKNYLCFIRGYKKHDNGNGNGNNQCDGGNRKHMGDMLHFEPTIVTYDKEHDDSDDSTHHQVLFAGTNEGYLHAFDTHTGEEIFAFMPQSLLKNIKPQYDDSEYRGHQYGIDGLPTIWKNDENHDGVINNDDSVYLYFGLRRGGNEYYALDITDVTAPTVKWKITGGSGDFAHLGQSWSRPYFARIHTSETDKTLREVIVFSGGYDAENQDKGREGNDVREDDDQVGNDVFIVDAKTGEFIWSIKKGTSGTGITGHEALTNSIPGGVRLLDLDRDGAIDRMYFADVKGNVWRVELDTDLTDADSPSLYDLADAKLIKFASFAGETTDTAEYRKFFSEPDVSIVRAGTSQSLLISLGSGDRTRPLNHEVVNRFYVLKDKHIYSPLPDDYEPITDEDQGDDSDLLTVTISSSENVIAVNNSIVSGGIFKSDKKGWYLSFGSEGEKVLANSVTSHGKVLFTTVVPDVYAYHESGVNCRLPETQGRAYVLDILKGTPVVDLSNNGGTPDNNDLYAVISANEIPGDIQIIFNEPSASDGGVCTAADCVQDVDLRAGKKRSQITSYNSGILESVYWSQSQGQ